MILSALFPHKKVKLHCFFCIYTLGPQAFVFEAPDESEEHKLLCSFAVHREILSGLVLLHSTSIEVLVGKLGIG